MMGDWIWRRLYMPLQLLLRRLRIYRAENRYG